MLTSINHCLKGVAVALTYVLFHATGAILLFLHTTLPTTISVAQPSNYCSANWPTIGPKATVWLLGHSVIG